MQTVPNLGIRKLKGQLYGNTKNFDYRGYTAYDCNNKKIGYVTDTYYDIETGEIQYLYIGHLDAKSFRPFDFVCPCHDISSVKDHKISLNVSLKELEDYEIYHPEYVFSNDRYTPIHAREIIGVV